MLQTYLNILTQSTMGMGIRARFLFVWHGTLKKSSFLNFLCRHASGTYDKATNSGGSDGGKIRFLPESEFGANKGLNIARDTLEKVKQKYPDLTYADLYILAGVVAIKGSKMLE